MKIILNIVIACLILLSSNALHLSSSKRRVSTEAAAYMRLTNLLGYTNGYKALGFGSSGVTVVFYCDLIINGKSVIDNSSSSLVKVSSTKTGNVSTTSVSQTTNASTVEKTISYKNTFELTIKTIRNISRVESNNSLKLIQNIGLSPQIQEMLFSKVDDGFKLQLDPLRFATASNNWQPQTIQINVDDKKGSIIKVELVVKNFKTLTASIAGDATEKSVKDLTDSLLQAKKAKLTTIRSEVRSISAMLSNLQLAIGLKVMYLNQINNKTIFDGEIKKVQIDRTKCLELKNQLLQQVNRLEMQWVETENSSTKITEQIKTCTSMVESFNIEIQSAQKKIDNKVQEEKTKLLTQNNLYYTQIFYWLEASFYYRVFSSRLVVDVNEVTVKFAEEKLKANSAKIREVFLPLETDLSFMN
jgi:hypothetical protein